MSAQGLSIIFITHKLNEVMAVSDRVTVLRKGKKIDTVNTSETTKSDLASMMVGRDVVFRVKRDLVNRGAPLLEIKGLSALNDFNLECLFGLDLTLHEREILGIAGVAGNSQKELFEILVGVRKSEYGEIHIKGVNITNKSPGYIQSQGLAHIPSDRIKEGLVMDFSISENLIMGHEWDHPYRKGMFLDDSAMQRFAEESLSNFKIAAPSVNHKTGNLSGGNLQKVILARELGSSPIVLIANQPCRGLDVGVVEYVYKELLRKREMGMGILLLSEDLDEILALSDRIAVIYQGHIVSVFTSENADIEKIGLLMAGVKE
jgi:simple sugar transport system ATP-binding protein